MFGDFHSRTYERFTYRTDIHLMEKFTLNHARHLDEEEIESLCVL